MFSFHFNKRNAEYILIDSVCIRTNTTTKWTIQICPLPPQRIPGTSQVVARGHCQLLVVLLFPAFSDEDKIKESYYLPLLFIFVSFIL